VARGKQPKNDTRATPPGKTARRGRGYGASAIYETLRREILDLSMKPGTLLDETELSERFKLSRSPVREALIRLSAEGLVTNLRNRSSVVASFDVTAVPSYLDAVELLYRATARLAAIRRTPAQLETIRRLHEELEQADRRNDLYETIRLNNAFHAALAEASGNSFFVDWTRSLLDQGQRVLGLYIQSIGHRLENDSFCNHVPIIKAIEAGNPDLAEEAGRRDADITAAQLRRHFLTKHTSDMPIVSRARSRT
jgi:DNA-binding GntR family transcriptional regulator